MVAVPIFDIHKLIDALPGWICLLGGAVLLAMFTWTPQWLACRDTAWQRDLMRLQAATLAEQHNRYEQFHAALEADDPVIVERLAFTELRHKRVGQQLHGAGPDIHLAANAQFIPDLMPSQAGQQYAGMAGGYAVSPVASTLPGSIYAWLRVPMPVVGQDVAPLRPIESHLTRIATGPFRLVALVFAVGVMAMGVMFQVKARPARLDDMPDRFGSA